MAQPTTRQQASVLEHRCRHRRRDDALIASRAELWAVTAAALDVGCGLRSVECVLKPLCGRVYVKHARRSQITHTTETATQQTHTLRRGTYNTASETQTFNRQISYEKSKSSIVRIFVRRCSAMCESSSYKNNSSRAVLQRASTSQRCAHRGKPSRPVRVEGRTCCCRWRSRPAGLDLRHVEPGSCAHKQYHRVRFAPRGQGWAWMCGAARGGSRRGRGEGRVQICWGTCRAHVRFEFCLGRGEKTPPQNSKIH